MKAILSILFLIVLISFTSKSKNECMKITCLNPQDTLSQKNGEIKTYFLIESPVDTLSGFDIRSSCGCEYPVWEKDMKVFPGHPDTVIIVSSLKGHTGYWLKPTTITAGNCSQEFFTGTWVITE